MTDRTELLCRSAMLLCGEYPDMARKLAELAAETENEQAAVNELLAKKIVELQQRTTWLYLVVAGTWVLYAVSTLIFTVIFR